MPRMLVLVLVLGACGHGELSVDDRDAAMYIHTETWRIARTEYRVRSCCRADVLMC